MKKVACERQIGRNYDERMRRLLARHYGEDNVTLTPAHNPFGLASAIAAYFDGDIPRD